MVLAAVGVGALTGWMNLRGPPGASTALYGPQNCGTSDLELNAAVAPELGSSFADWLSLAGSNVSNQTGHCVHLDVGTSLEDGYVPGLSGRSVDFVAATGGVPSGDTSSLASPVDVYPVAVDPVAVDYDLPGVSAPLQLNGTVLAEIYAGTITHWDAPAVQALNPSVPLPAAPSITVLHLSTPSVTNTVFTTFIATSSPSWNASVGAGATVPWPSGPGFNSPAALLAELTATPGAIGYSELINGSGMPSQTALVENSGEAFVAPDSAGVEAAASVGAGTPTAVSHEWSNLSLVDMPGKGSYPLVQVSYIGLYHDLAVGYGGNLTLANATWLMTFLWWISQSVAFAPLPLPFLSVAQSTLTNVTYDGTPILQVQDSEGGENGGETGEF